MKDNKTKQTGKQTCKQTSLSHTCRHSQQKWYFPRAGDAGAPSLSKAYAYYEHITLPRHFTGENEADQVLRRAEPGDTGETELYSPFTTSAASFIEWGIGVDLYFSSLRALGYLLFLAGILNIPAIRYYASSDYSPNLQKDFMESTFLWGSAICTTDEWVVCGDCLDEKGEFNNESARKRLAIASDNTVLALRNMCAGVAKNTVITHWVTLLVITVIMILLSLYWRAREVRFDEDKYVSSSRERKRCRLFDVSSLLTCHRCCRTELQQRIIPLW